MIVVVGGEKGGTGKSTIATNLAAIRAKEGRDVLLVDTDTQASAAMWARLRASDEVQPAITCVALYGEGLAKEIQKLKPKYDDIVIDCGGRDTPELRASMLVANVLLTPTRISTFDLHSLALLNKIIGECQVVNKSLKAKVFINMAPTHATSSDADDMAEQIANMRNRNFELLDAAIRARVAFARAATDGLSVLEVEGGDERAIFEMTRLYSLVFGKAKVAA